MDRSAPWHELWLNLRFLIAEVLLRMAVNLMPESQGRSEFLVAIGPWLKNQIFTMEVLRR
jgi:hypothetical protein